MVGPSRRSFPMIAMYAAFLAALHPLVVESAPRRLEVDVLHADEYAKSVVTIQEPEYPLGIGAQEHAKIASVLDTTKEMMDTANALVRDKRTLKEGRKMMEEATTMFQEVKDHLRRRNQERESNRDLLRARYLNHDLQEAAEDGERGMDVSRRIYETVRVDARKVAIIIFQ